MLILAMSFSGSMVFLFILICMFCGKKVLSSTWIYAMLKINLFFYCIPLPLFKTRYNYILSKLLDIPLIGNDSIYPMKNIIQIEKMGNISFDWKLYVFIVWIIWIIGLFASFIKHSKQYNDSKIEKKTVIKDRNYLEIFEEIKRELKIKKKVTLICVDDSIKIFTTGIAKKYIIIPKDGIESEDLYYIFKHELIHIKRSDVIYRYIAIFAILIHWFNPLIYFYFYMLSIYCEQSCDTMLIHNMEKPERKKYGELIINMALYEKKGKQQYRSYFSSSKKNIERRLKNMLKIEKTKTAVKICSLLVSGLILFAGSLTVYAYEQPKVVTWQTESHLEELEREQVEQGFINSADIQFDNSETIIVREFIGEDGISYKLEDLGNTSKTQILCSHSFVSGYYKQHVKYSNNSCKTDYYNADRCVKCGDIVVKSYSHTETSTKCTH